jgi:predicted enzyme related to lactoylglutathione lyase
LFNLWRKHGFLGSVQTDVSVYILAPRRRDVLRRVRLVFMLEKTQRNGQQGHSSRWWLARCICSSPTGQGELQRKNMKHKRNPVGWFEIYVQDMKRAKMFYEKTFAMKLQALPGLNLEMEAFPMGPKLPGCSGALVRMEGKDSGGGGTIVYFSCSNCAVEAALAKKNGGEIFKKKFSIGEYGFIALVVDTEGNMIGLHSLK